MWENEIAIKLKESIKGAKDKAITGASAYLGTIEAADPLKISIMDGEAYFEESEGEIIVVDAAKFSLDYLGIRAKGLDCVVVPVNSLDVIALIDVINGNAIKKALAEKADK